MDTKKIGAFIAENRKQKGLTQEQLGEKLGVTNKTISRWENGNYMPDLSLLEPLSKELGITLNELLAGEKIVKEDEVTYSEQNLLNTIAYSTQKLQQEHKKISICFMIVGILICICALSIFPSESSWGSIYSYIGLLLIIIGIFRELKYTSLMKKGLIAMGIFLGLYGVLLTVDFVGVTQFKRPPLYRYMTTTIFKDDNKLIEYKNLFYNVFRINADSSNEYYLIDYKKQYTIDTVPTSPFNQDVSSIDHLMQYKSQYIGDNSNTGQLIGSLPLSEYGYVFEIDSENLGLIINYHATDWFNNEDLYTESALVYNSVSFFTLIDNLEYITFHFSGSSYKITREAIENNYPNYDDIFKDDAIDTKKFHKYVESKMNDSTFVLECMKLFTEE